jgi:hypothetical protein
MEGRPGWTFGLEQRDRGGTGDGTVNLWKKIAMNVQTNKRFPAAELVFTVGAVECQFCSATLDLLKGENIRKMHHQRLFIAINLCI